MPRIVPDQTGAAGTHAPRAAPPGAPPDDGGATDTSRGRPPRSVPPAEQATADRRRAVAQTASALTGIYGPAEVRRLRRDWPA